MKEQERNYTPIGVYVVVMFVFIIVLTIGLAIYKSVNGDDIERIKEKHTIEKVNYQGREYYIFTMENTRDFEVVHSPDCLCKSQK